MRVMQRVFQIELSAACDNAFLMLDVALQNFLKRKYLRLAVFQREHIYGARILKLAVFVKLIEDYLKICVAAALYNNAHAVTTGFVTDTRDTFDSLVAHQICNGLNEHCLVDLIRYLRNDDPVLVFLDIRLCANHNASAARLIRLTYAAETVYRCGGRKIGALYILHKLRGVSLGIIHKVDSAVNDLREVMRRDIRRHTDRNTHGSVYKKVGETGGQNGRLSAPVVEVRHELHNFFFDIPHHFGGYL